VTILASPEVKSKLLESGIEATQGTPEQFATPIRAETARWVKVVKASGARAE
jgi:tripartite-type tricarboxylate transporter receptor subunit TctC